jgi:hypothetical protein
MSDGVSEPLDCEAVDAEPVDDAMPDDTVDAEVVDDADPDAIVVDIEIGPGSELDIRDPSIPPLDPDAILDAEVEDKPIRDGHQGPQDGARPSGGSGGLPKSEPAGASGKGGAKKSRKSWNPLARRPRGVGGGGGGPTVNVSLLGGLHVLSGNRADPSVIRTGGIGTGNTGINASPGSRGRRPSAGKRR